MARKKGVEQPLKKGERVVATLDLPGIPEGTTGKVKLVNGLTWRRYWVFFDNGIQRGSVDDQDIVRLKDFESFKEKRAAAAEAALHAPEASADAPAAAADDAPAAAGASAAASRVPAHLLERSKAAKARHGLG